MTPRLRKSCRLLLVLLSLCSLPLWTPRGMAYALGGIVLCGGSVAVGMGLYTFVERRRPVRVRAGGAKRKEAA